MPADKRAIIGEIEAERQRQIACEGWTPEHDDAHDRGDLLRAAVIYYQHAKNPDNVTIGENGAPFGWPWEPQWWKPKTPRRDLIRAGALCLAEKDRLLRETRGAYCGHVDHKLRLILNELIRIDSEAQNAG